MQIDPLSILASNPDCKIQSLTVSDQHATLLLSHPEIVERYDDNVKNNEPSEENDGDETSGKNYSNTQEVSKRTTVQSLLKLTIIPFHKAILGSNPIISIKDRENGIPPERNSSTGDNFDPKASDDISSFLQQYNYCLKSESGAEYSYHEAFPTRNLLNKVINVEVNNHNNNRMESQSTTSKIHDENENKFPKEDSFISQLHSTISKFGAFDVELISPATPYQISRAMPSLGHTLIQETPSLYKNVVQPFIQNVIDSGSISWIQNLIEVKKEKERLLVNHEEFIINIDTKWRSHPPPLTTPREEWLNHPSTVDLYCLGIVKASGIATLRDLRQKHVPLLKSMAEEGLSAIKRVYGVDNDQVRIFIHYQPQFYHFHIHFTRLENEVGCSVERGHLVSDVIQNLEMDDEYYCKRIISYKLLKGSPLENLIQMYSYDEV
mmetsp:Transcript_6728/g.13965  ORF Transcript_6728/g.13965 Transcript_6728/m.13965 type:complete len:436 (+) Transcript_6728:142-1449(+)